jgi:hypothetical protein
MNTDLLLEIAEAIEAQPDHFDMTEFLNWDPTWAQPHPPRSREEFDRGCGTTACVAGWACVLNGIFNGALWDTGRKLLDLTYAEASRLFYCHSISVWWELADEYGWDRRYFGLQKWSQITAYQAADVLKRIAKGDIEL